MNKGLRVFGSEQGNCMSLLGTVGTAVLQPIVNDT